MSQKASDYETIPLCPDHHRNGGPGVAYHAAPKAWQAKFGTERELLAKTLQLLETERLSKAFVGG